MQILLCVCTTLLSTENYIEVKWQQHALVVFNPDRRPDQVQGKNLHSKIRTF